MYIGHEYWIGNIKFILVDRGVAKFFRRGYRVSES